MSNTDKAAPSFMRRTVSGGILLLGLSIPFSTATASTFAGITAVPFEPTTSTAARNNSGVRERQFVATGLSFSAGGHRYLHDELGCEEVILRASTSAASKAKSGRDSTEAALRLQQSMPGETYFLQCRGSSSAAQAEYILSGSAERMIITSMHDGKDRVEVELAQDGSVAQLDPLPVAKGSIELARLLQDWYFRPFLDADLKERAARLDARAKVVQGSKFSGSRQSGSDDVTRNELAIDRIARMERSQDIYMLYNGQKTGRPRQYTSQYLTEIDVGKGSGTDCTTRKDYHSYDFLAVTMSPTGSLFGDDCGHMHANSLGGTGWFNGTPARTIIFSQNASINRGCFNKHEQKFKAFVESRTFQLVETRSALGRTREKVSSSESVGSLDEYSSSGNARVKPDEFALPIALVTCMYNFAVKGPIVQDKKNPSVYFQIDFLYPSKYPENSTHHYRPTSYLHTSFCYHGGYPTAMAECTRRFIQAFGDLADSVIRSGNQDMLAVKFNNYFTPIYDDFEFVENDDPSRANTVRIWGTGSLTPQKMITLQPYDEELRKSQPSGKAVYTVPLYGKSPREDGKFSIHICYNRPPIAANSNIFRISYRHPTWYLWKDLPTVKLPPKPSEPPDLSYEVASLSGIPGLFSEMQVRVENVTGGRNAAPITIRDVIISGYKAPNTLIRTKGGNRMFSINCNRLPTYPNSDID